MDFLQNILDNSQVPILTAFVLGLLTAVSPCPLATNITAIGYIGRDMGSRRRLFWSGVLYTVGRIIAYSVLGAILIYILRSGADMFSIQKGVSKWGEMLVAPVMLLIGLFMLFGDRFSLPKFGFSGNLESNKLKGLWGSLLLGMMGKYQYDLSVVCKGGHKYLTLTYYLGEMKHIEKEIPLVGNQVYLRVEGSPDVYTFSYSKDNSKFEELAKMNTRFLSSETAGGFTGVYLGLFAQEKAKSNSYADFDWFEYTHP